jgi:2,4-dienoyl-CoA reductase-like NADH-dependent reductase (Old Yellow Enzyme family)
MVHYGARAIGGAGLLFNEMTDITADARISLGCTGMYVTTGTRRRNTASSRCTARRNTSPARTS